MSKPITLELTPQEAQALADCLDIATKAGGIQVARFTVVIADRLIRVMNTSRDELPVDVAE